MNTRTTLIALALASCAGFAHADYSFSNISANWLDWSDGTQERTQKGPFGGKNDFGYLEAEGGMGGNWGELYGFLDVENPDKSTHEDAGQNRRYASKLVARVNVGCIGNLPLQAYAHVYDFRDADFYDQNRVLGLGTALTSGNFWIKPFLGAHQEFKQGVGAHRNGMMGGWVLGYSFNLAGQSLMLTQWHEIEFAREDAYLAMAKDGEVVRARKLANNGAVSLWWNASKDITAGVSYRYADHKLGAASYQNALISTLKYNF
ncbi:outer membrane protein OmpK [Vogesella sp. GCM10023246]|uniref:Outer membrane protein OmpK n=1 Tax=Vogesella oryzagri TaxID=3160864 RepID=A0ABV1M562_9NEIS